MSTTFQLLLRRASTYLNIGFRRQSLSDELDEEVVYSKNNVCVHSIDKHNNQLNHNYGYLTVKRYDNNSHNSDDKKRTLCLQWTPNQCLTKQLEPNCDYDNSHQNNGLIEGIDSIDSEIQLKNAKNESSDEKSIGSVGTVGDVCDLNIIANNQINNNNEKITNSSHSSDKDLMRRNSSVEHTTNDGLSVSSPERSVRRCQSCRNTPLKSCPINENSINTFSADLKQIKSLRLFFGGEDLDSSDGLGADTTNGQLVVVSRDSFYKVFHFHCGGLDKLLNVLKGLDFWDKSESLNETNYLQFSIIRPKLKSEECHPEESLYVAINDSQWRDSINEFGQIIGEQNLRKIIFFTGIEPELRRHIWPFLLRRYDFDSTYAERDSEDSIKAKEYYQIIYKLETMSETERDWFWRNVESIVEKDVIRTDRSNPFFAGDNNENIDKMKRILINFGLYCPQMGYTQGMSDLLAPLLSEFQCEHKTFWCFVSMMRMTRFVCSPKDTDMDHNLALLRELLRLMHPKFFGHIRQFSDDSELLFTHRWILLCFKREFADKEALHIWESCWSHFQTYYFHLFICLAIIFVYGEDVIDHNMDSDEILFHFSTLSHNMNGNLILRKARGLLYEFNVLPRIPCSLRYLTESGLEMWDSNRERVIECVKELPNMLNTGANCLCDTQTNDIPINGFDFIEENTL